MLCSATFKNNESFPIVSYKNTADLSIKKLNYAPNPLKGTKDKN
jgi:hypothetical protein